GRAGAGFAPLAQIVWGPRVGRAGEPLLGGPAAPRRGRFDLKMPVRVRRFGSFVLDEPAQLELPLGRAPPRGAILVVRAEAKLPRGPSHGFDERTWLRRHGIHVVLAGDSWRLIGHRRGLGGVGDRASTWLARAVAGDLHGERRGVLLGVVLGDEQGLSEPLRADFRASGLYHLLSQSRVSRESYCCATRALWRSLLAFSRSRCASASIRWACSTWPSLRSARACSCWNAAARLCSSAARRWVAAARSCATCERSRAALTRVGVSSLLSGTLPPSYESRRSLRGWRNARSRRWRAERTTRTQPRVGTAAGRGLSNRSRPPARASRGRSDGRRTPLRQERTTRALGPGLPDPMGKVNGDADVQGDTGETHRFSSVRQGS